MPLNADGSLKEVAIGGKRYKGRDLFNHIGMTMRAAFNAETDSDEKDFCH